MSREIKFRCWDQKDKKYLLPEKQGFVILPAMPSFGVTLPYENCSNPGNIDEDCIDWADEDLLMGRYELEQYTGLTDKNGKEIYEGDIIQETILADDTTDGTYRYEVYWDEDTLCWSIKGISDIDYHLHNDLWETNASREVIGNIHEKDKLVDFDHFEGGEE